MAQSKFRDSDIFKKPCIVYERFSKVKTTLLKFVLRSLKTVLFYAS